MGLDLITCKHDNVYEFMRRRMRRRSSCTVRIMRGIPAIIMMALSRKPKITNGTAASIAKFRSCPLLASSPPCSLNLCVTTALAPSAPPSVTSCACLSFCIAGKKPSRRNHKDSNSRGLQARESACCKGEWGVSIPLVVSSRGYTHCMS
jgi:hypothetical protein